MIIPLTLNSLATAALEEEECSDDLFDTLFVIDDDL